MEGLKSYKSLWQAIIRPVRQEYTLAELGPAYFTIGRPNEKEVGVKRTDLTLKSS